MWSSEMGSPPLHSIIGAAAVAANQDGRMELVVTVEDRTVWHKWQTSINNGWSDWDFFGIPNNFSQQDPPLLALCGDGKLNMLYGPYSRGQIAANNGWGPWGTWSSPDKFQGNNFQAIAANKDKRLEVFVFRSNPQGAYFDLAHASQNHPTVNSDWSFWASLGAPPVLGLNTLRPLAVGANKDGRLELFAIGFDGALWHIWQEAPDTDNAHWSKWYSLGRPSTTPLGWGVAVGSNQDGRLEVFAAGNVGDDHLYHIWQTSPNNGWSEWARFVAPGQSGRGSPLVGRNSSLCLEVFVPIADNAGAESIGHASQAQINDGWNDPDILFLGLQRPECTVGQNQDGRLEIFAQVGGSLLHRWQRFDPGHPW